MVKAVQPFRCLWCHSWTINLPPQTIIHDTRHLQCSWACKSFIIAPIVSFYRLNCLFWWGEFYRDNQDPTILHQAVFHWQPWLFIDKLSNFSLFMWFALNCRFFSGIKALMTHYFPWIINEDFNSEPYSGRFWRQAKWEKEAWGLKHMLDAYFSHAC